MRTIRPLAIASTIGVLLSAGMMLTGPAEAHAATRTASACPPYPDGVCVPYGPYGDQNTCELNRLTVSQGSPPPAYLGPCLYVPVGEWIFYAEYVP